jgi:hypothetical protein
VIRTALLFLLCGTAAWAADIDGKWKLVYTTGNGLQREAILEVKTADGKLDGKVSSDRGTAVIESGAVNGDEISFSLLRKGNGDEIKVEFTGKIEDGVLKLNMQYGKREAVAVIGRRI